MGARPNSTTLGGKSLISHKSDPLAIKCLVTDGYGDSMKERKKLLKKEKDGQRNPLCEVKE